MQTTPNLGLKKPDNTDPTDIQDLNDNADKIDQEIVKKVDKTGDGSSLTNKFSQAAAKANLVSGEKQETSFGKIMKWFADLTNVDNTSDTNKPVSTAQQTAINAKVSTSGGDIADTKVSGFTASTAAYPVPAAGETPRVFMGKVKKFFEDMNNLRASMLFIGGIVNNCVTNNASLPLSAAQGKALMDLYTQLNRDLSLKQSIKVQDISTGDYTNHQISFGYYSKDGTINTNVYIDGNAFCRIPPVNEFEVHKNSADHDGRYYTEWEVENKLNETLNKVIVYSDVVDASAGNKTINTYLFGTGNYLLVANKGPGESETALYLLVARNEMICKTAIKTVPGISIDTYQQLLGVNYAAPNVGVLSITRLTF